MESEKGTQNFDLPDLTRTNLAPIEPDRQKREDGVASSAIPSFKFHCPKCGEANSLDDEECRHCGVIFEAMVDADEPQLRADIGLVKSWQAVRSNYADMKFHEAFFNECFEKQRLPFAALKYMDILNVNPSDDIAIEMKKRILAHAWAMAEPIGSKTKPSDRRWYGVFTLAYITSGGMIAAGLSDVNFRPLLIAGIGTLALTLMIRAFFHKDALF